MRDPRSDPRQKDNALQAAIAALEAHMAYLMEDHLKHLGGSPSQYENVATALAELRAALAEGDAAEAKNALMVSETYRRKYAKGKYEMYAMGGAVADAAMKHLPCSEGPLEHYEMKIEREHSPLLVEHNARLSELLKTAESRAEANQADAELLRWWFDERNERGRNEAQEETERSRTVDEWIASARRAKAKEESDGKR